MRIAALFLLLLITGCTAQRQQPVVMPTGVSLTPLSFSETRQQMLENLPCKWIGQDAGPFDTQTQDFVCQGGNWGTITVLLEEEFNQVTDMRLVWRAWNRDVHPSGGEANAVPPFLNFILEHYVPQAVAPSVANAFWQCHRERWFTPLARVWMRCEQGEGYVLHKLALEGADGVMMTPSLRLPAAEKTIEPAVFEPTEPKAWVEPNVAKPVTVKSKTNPAVVEKPTEAVPATPEASEVVKPVVKEPAKTITSPVKLPADPYKAAEKLTKPYKDWAESDADGSLPERDGEAQEPLKLEFVPKAKPLYTEPNTQPKNNNKGPRL